MVRVKRGQVWRETDKRMKGRTVLVIAVERDYARVVAPVTGRWTRIRLDRFDGKQYVLVEAPHA